MQCDPISKTQPQLPLEDSEAPRLRLNKDGLPVLTGNVAGALRSGNYLRQTKSQAIERLKAETIRVGDCLEWRGHKNKDGYGQIRYLGITTSTHRLAYETFVGPIPPGKRVLHKCDNPPCCNPDHLFLGTQLDNVRDCIVKGRFKIPLRGEANANSKLTDAKVRNIRLLGLIGWGLTDIGSYYGVTKQVVGAILKGRIWKHVV